MFILVKISYNKREVKKQIMGYKITQKIINQNDEQLEDICKKSNNLYNVTNYYIRQCYTGYKKIQNEEKLTANEEEVINIIEQTLPKLDEISKNNMKTKIANLEKLVLDNPEDKEIQEKLKKQKEKLANFKPHHISKSGFPSYEIIEGVFKVTNNVDYRALPSHTAQQTMRQCFADWKSFFEKLKNFKLNPKEYNGRPNIPHYKTKGGKCKTRYTYKVCHLNFDEKSNAIITLNNSTILLNFGKYIKPSDTLQQVEILPHYGGYKVTLILKDDDYAPVTRNPERVFGIDLGVDNFATISNNIGVEPIIIKGGMFKSRNQYFNKTRSEYLSKLQKGHDSKTSQKTSHKLESLSKNRENFFRDAFYKIAHRIINSAKENNIDTIIIGHNENQKQNINIGKTNNQNFVSIPYYKFIEILRYLCLKKGIQFLVTEESYTSKCSFLDMDELPVYKANDETKYTFSGRRISRGLYQSKDGIILNADINGASNIIRKVYSDAFVNVTDYSYLQKPLILNFRDFYFKKESKIS